MSEVFLCKYWGGKCEGSFFVQMVRTNLGTYECVLKEKLRCFWVSLREDNKGWIQDGGIQDDWIQDGCHHQVNQNQLVWVRVRVEGECFWVNLREDSKVSESKMPEAESQMEEFKMVSEFTIITLSQNEWMKVFLYKWWETILASVSESEWISLSQSQSVLRVFLSVSERR